MERTLSVWCEDDNMFEVWCVILLDRRSAVSRGTEGETVSLLCSGKLDKRRTSPNLHLPSRPSKNRE